MKQNGLARQSDTFHSSDAASEISHSRLRRFLDFLEITESDRQLAQQLWSIVDPEISQIIDRFYVKVHGTEIGSHVSAPGLVEQLKTKQRRHWTKLFTSQFDEEYVCSVQRVGIRHRELKLDTAWYVAGYITIKMDLIQAVLKADLPMVEKGRLLRVIEKYVTLDMTIALSAYENDNAIID